LKVIEQRLQDQIVVVQQVTQLYKILNKFNLAQHKEALRRKVHNIHREHLSEATLAKIQEEITDMKKVADLLRPFEDDIDDKIIWDTEPNCCPGEHEGKEFKSSLLMQHRPEKIDSH
jgi:hypothetical protein